jgi:hypothetical protein
MVSLLDVSSSSLTGLAAIFYLASMDVNLKLSELIISSSKAIRSISIIRD